MRRTACGALASVLLVAVTSATAQAVRPGPLTVCMAEANPPLSLAAGGIVRGVDVSVAEAIAADLHRPLAIVPFESKLEGDSTLSHELNALLSSGVCELASGFPLLRTDLGAPSRPTARVPDHPGAPPPPKRPWVQLGALAASRAYHAIAMALVVRDASRANVTLADPSDARIGAVSGTLAGTIVSLYHNGKLRGQMVSLSQQQDVLAELEAGTIDAALVTLDRLDAWRLAHPATPIVRTTYLHPLRINLGFVARSERVDLLSAVDRVVDAALASGDLARWHAANGSSWVAPVDPQVHAFVGIADLLRD